MSAPEMPTAWTVLFKDHNGYEGLACCKVPGGTLYRTCPGYSGPVSVAMVFVPDPVPATVEMPEELRAALRTWALRHESDAGVGYTDCRDLYDVLRKHGFPRRSV